MKKLKRFAKTEEGQCIGRICCFFGMWSAPISFSPYIYLIPIFLVFAFIGLTIVLLSLTKEETEKHAEPQEIANASEAWQKMKKEVQ